MDLSAGVTMGVFLIPQSIAYAGLAQVALTDRSRCR
jgi:MFS superfamily sulfate permease-like transporter